MSRPVPGLSRDVPNMPAAELRALLIERGSLVPASDRGEVTVSRFWHPEPTLRLLGTEDVTSPHRPAWLAEDAQRERDSARMPWRREP
jgi:hypothetical protein